MILACIVGILPSMTNNRPPTVSASLKLSGISSTAAVITMTSYFNAGNFSLKALAQAKVTLWYCSDNFCWAKV